MNVDIDKLNERLDLYCKLHEREIAENVHRLKLKRFKAAIVRCDKKDGGEEKGRS